MLKRIVRSKYYIPALVALVIGTEAWVNYKYESKLNQLEERVTKLEKKVASIPPPSDEESVRAYVAKVRICELACYGIVKKFSESTGTCECMEKSLDSE
jgi:hypothetical protein